MKVVVNDANILIDLVKLKMLQQFFALEHLFYTSDMIFEELHHEQQQELQPYVEEGRLSVMSFDMDELMLIGELLSEKPQLSEQDCSAIICALKVNGELLTSDNPLRKFAKSKQLIVRGHLWVFDQLVEQGIVEGNLAVDKLSMFIEEINPRLGLPPKECEARLAAWKGLK
jgi:predicted nucleic acid-binding protein